MFHLLFALITLPFTILGSLLGLLGLSTRIFLFPLKIFARHTVLCLVVIGGVILYYAFKSDPHALDTLKPAPKENVQAKAKSPAPIIEPVSKHEDGDSSFATDLYASMTEPERNYYSRVFYGTMGSVPDGKTYEWAHYNIHGALTPVKTFTTKSGLTCRSFTEVLKVHRIQQTLSGTACDNGGGSWCKLKPNATPACGLGHKPGAFDGITSAVKNLF